MMYQTPNLFILIIIVTINFLADHVNSSVRIQDKIYYTLTSDHYCPRRLNATRSVGCTSNLGGNNGILWIVEDESDLKHVLQTGQTPPYIVVLKQKHFTKANILKFKDNLNRINGVVFNPSIENEAPVPNQPFSPEDSCPNRYSGLYNGTEFAECKMNTWLETSASGLMYEDIPFPIFMIKDKKSLDMIEDCFSHNVDTNNRQVQKSSPLCGIHLDSFMTAAVNSKKCLNSHSFSDELMQQTGSRCRAIIPRNIFAYFRPAFSKGTQVKNKIKPDYVEKNSIIMLTAKLSSISLFNDDSPGADSTITGIVALLSVADALRYARPTFPEVGNNIVFALIDSEPFDYTGSTRMVDDMVKGNFPNSYFHRTSNDSQYLMNMNLSAINTIIDLNQLANYKHSKDLYIHFDPSRSSANLDSLAQKLFDSGNRHGINFQKATSKDGHSNRLPLPPSSVQTFLKYLQHGDELTGAVISNYNYEYKNKFYHSTYDSFHNINETSMQQLVDHLVKVSSSLAEVVLELALKGDKNVQLSVDRELVSNLLQCYLVSADCKLFTEAWYFGRSLPKGPIQTYKDPTYDSDDMNVEITKNLLSYFLREEQGSLNETQCYKLDETSGAFAYLYINGQRKQGSCIKSQVVSIYASSPAFSLKDNSIDIDLRYPAWTVSANNIRNPVSIYLIHGPLYDWVVFSLGILITIVSFISVKFVNNFCEQNQPPRLSA